MSRVLFFTSWYNEKHEARRAELETCVRNCLESPDLDMVYLLCEGSARFPIEHPKLVQQDIDHRPHYEDYFKLANQVSHENDCICVANSDVYPAPGLRQQVEGNLLKGDAWALSRWDIQENGSEPVCLCRRDSQDSFLMRAPVRTINAFFPGGLPGADNRLCRLLDEAGYSVSNPAQSVKFYHLHLTQVHSYQSGRDTVPSPYLLIEPTTLGVVQPGKYQINWQPNHTTPLTPHTRS